jgi:hypothetical protein
MTNNKMLSLFAIGGVLLLFAGTWLHPMHADPNLPAAAFAEYAADRLWIASHLLQLLGAAGILGALMLLGRVLADGRGQSVAALASAGAIASLAIAAALQAVDGVALKAMVNAWAAADGPEKSSLFHATFAVRQVEAGLAAMASLLFGVTVSLFGIALLLDRRFPTWLGIVGLIGGGGTAIAGIAIAYTGFSELAMIINMPASILLLLWMIALGVIVWSKPAQAVPAV